MSQPTPNEPTQEQAPQEELIINDQKIKKVFHPIFKFLQANPLATVDTILNQLISLAKASTGGEGRSANTSLRHPSTNELIAVRCYYHDKWELVESSDFGIKVSSATGLNNMCKEGNAAWTKQQTQGKKDELAILDNIMSEKITVAEVPAIRDAIKTARDLITARKDATGYDTKEDAWNAFLILEADKEAETVT